jgi:SAM-dependent methyltransferase
MAGAFLRSRLAHPLTAGRSVDDPETTELRRSIILGKPSLKAIYREWYEDLRRCLPDGPGPILELGSGAGFMKSAIAPLITSDVLRIGGVDLVADGTRLPFTGGALRAILMVNVFHHLADPRRFLDEAARCIVPRGRIGMVEPWATAWSRRIYAFHSEPFDTRRPGWTLPPGGPLTAGNGALPWIVFHRDRAMFEAEFPLWEVQAVRPIMPLRYLLTGGVSMRQLAPSWSFELLAAVENALRPLWNRLGMFALIVLRRRSS